MVIYMLGASCEISESDQQHYTYCITVIDFTAMLKIRFGTFKTHISLHTMKTLISLTIQKLKVVPQQYIFCETEDEHK